jgi:Zn-dependent protease
MESQQIDGSLELVDRLLPAVRQVMSIREMTSGGAEDRFAARFRGRMYSDAGEVYDRLQPIFTTEEVTLVLRSEDDEDVVLAFPGVIRPRPSNPWINLGLFLLTVISVLLAGATYSYQGPIPETFLESFIFPLREIQRGIPFAVSMLAILLAHEFGHYLAARYHKTAVSLPYFLPFPFSPLGTLGAAIRLKEPPKNKRVLLDIGLAGPLAGLAIAIPILIVGLSLSELNTLPLAPESLENQMSGFLEGNSVLYLALKYLVKGRLLPAPVDFGGVEPILYWVRYIFIGLPIPYGGLDVIMHPLAWAGWAGLLVTGLNLIPAGTLDGGHISYVLFGRRAAKLVPFIIVALVILGIFWWGWLLWAGLIFFIGRMYAQPLNDITPLDNRRKALAIFGLIIFVLVFIPIPLMGF